MTTKRWMTSLTRLGLAMAASLLLLPAHHAQAQNQAADQFQAGDYTIGDRLRVLVYEETQGGFGGQALFPRVDLGGEFVVDAAGQIALPRVGGFSIAGLDYDGAREQLIATLQAINPSLSEVHFELLAREPVYVVGLVREPGSFPYAPGMFAIQAIALAGGYERPSDRVARLVDGRRERERLEQAVERRARLVARMDALEAVRDGRQPTPSPLLVSLTSPQDAARLIATEADSARVESAVGATRAQEAQANASTARAELSTLQASANEIDARIDALESYAQSLRQPDMRLANQGLVVATRQEQAALEQQKTILTTAMLEAQRRLTQAQSGQATFRLQREAFIAENLIAAQEELEQLEGTVANASVAADALEASVSGLAQGASPIITVVRRTLDGTATLAASDLTQLAPGDVVDVRAQTPLSQ